jgi:hypothetical protein
LKESRKVNLFKKGQGLKKKIIVMPGKRLKAKCFEKDKKLKNSASIELLTQKTALKFKSNIFIRQKLKKYLLKLWLKQKFTGKRALTNDVN